MKEAAYKMPPIQYDAIQMQGGVDQMTPLLNLKPGMPRDALNFEASILGGYTRIGGYERSDGQPLPSSKNFNLIFVNAFTNIPAVGDTVTGFTSGATGYVLTTGANYVVVCEVVGIFALAETIKDGALVVGTMVASTGVPSASLLAAYTALAADRQRTHIAAVPGSGPVRGVFIYSDVVYAFRDNAGGTASALYKQTSGGWSLVPFFNEVSFTAGTTLPADGATLTQGGITATVKRVVTQSGAWAGSAAGRFIVDTPSGGNFAAGAATLTGGTTVTLSGAQTAITPTVGGKYEVIIGNFTGSPGTIRAYGCDGVNRCFEFDGTVYVPITTGTVPDTPTHIAVHKNFLFIAIGGSLLFSAPGLPYDWTAIDGAGIVAVGDLLTNLIELPGAQTTAAMGVYTRSTTYILYGTGASTFNLVPLNTGCGGLSFTAQNMAHTYVTDDRGIIDMQETLNYGNFDINTVTYPVNNFIGRQRTKVTCATLNRQKSQYRLFYSDGYGLYVTNMHGQYAWMNIASSSMPVLFPNPVQCITNAKLSTGEEVVYFGSTNGFVYKLDSGSSFDGATIASYLLFGADQIGSPRTMKHYSHAQLEISGNSYMQLNFGYTLGYNATTILQPTAVPYGSDFSMPFWDHFTWDHFTWDGSVNNPSTECDMTGTGENYALLLSSSSDAYYPFTINSAIVHYRTRRGKR